MKNKYKIIAICGQAGAGKDTLLKHLTMKYVVHEIISCTTRPMREGEQEGVNYYYLTKEQFVQKLMNDEMLEATEFNGWFYGTMKQGLDPEGWNVGVFNPEGIDALMENPDIELYIAYLDVPAKHRLLRQLYREENPDVDEIIRRYGTDKKDFNLIHYRFPLHPFKNLLKDDLNKAVTNIARDCRLVGKTN